MKKKKKSKNILDLHETRHQDVHQVLSEFIWKSKDANTMTVEIITGNSHTMKQMVKSVVCDVGELEVFESPLYNQGKLIVDYEQ